MCPAAPDYGSNAPRVGRTGRRVATGEAQQPGGERSPAWIGTVAPEDATGLLAEVYDEIARRSASVANILRVQSLHPEALRAHYAHYRTIMFGRGSLSRAERESIAVAVSAANGCRY